jgi:hypothetical protein
MRSPHADATLGRACINRISRKTPLGKTAQQPPRATSTRTQQFDSAVRIHAVGTAAVRDVVLGLRKFFQPSLQFIHRNRDGAGDVPRGVLVRRPRVENDDICRARSLQQIGHRDGLGVRAVGKMFADEAIEFRAALLRHLSQRNAQLGDGVIGEPIPHEQLFFPAVNESRTPERLEMLRGVGERYSALFRERLDRAAALCQQLEELDPDRTRQRLAQLGEVPVEAVLEVTMCGVGLIQVINSLLEY